MDIQGVEVKAVKWTPEKRDDEGEVKQESRVAVTLEFDGDDTAAVRQLLDYAKEGYCRWTVIPMRELLVAAK